MLQSDNTSNQRAQGQSEISAGPEHVELVITAAAASISAAREQSECDEKLCYVCMDARPGEPHLAQLPCSCSGSVGAIHLDCFQKDLVLNRRTECSICHSKYTFEDRVSEFGTFYRLYLAFRGNPVWLTISTLSCLTLGAISLLLLDERNSLFKVNNVLFSQDVGMLGGGSAACLLFVVWRYTLMSQPVAEVKRTLMSLPDANGRRRVLFEVTIKAPPGIPEPRGRPAGTPRRVAWDDSDERRHPPRVRRGDEPASAEEAERGAAADGESGTAAPTEAAGGTQQRGTEWAMAQDASGRGGGRQEGGTRVERNEQRQGANGQIPFAL